MVDKRRFIYRILEVSAVLLFIFSHFYRLSTIPHGVNVDELGMGYDAWSLAHYGVDRFLFSYPVYFNNYGGGQSVLYGYLTAVLVAITGGNLSLLKIRLAGATLLGISAIVFERALFGYFRNMKRSILFLFSVSTFPSLIMMWRMGFDCNLMMPMMLVLFVLLIVAHKMEQKSLFYAAFAGFMGGVLLYTYALSHIILPLFLLLYFFYLYLTKNYSVKKVLAFGIPLVVLAAPLILFHVINLFDLTAIHLGSISIYPIDHYRSGEIGVQHLSLRSASLFFKSLLIWDEVNFDSVPEYGTVYYISIIFILIGMVRAIKIVWDSIRTKRWTLYALPLLWTLSCFALGLFMDVNAYRMNSVLGCFCFFWCDGIVCLFERIKEAIPYKKTAQLFICAITLAYTILFVSFARFYFGGAYSENNRLSFFRDTIQDELKLIEEYNPSSHIYFGGIYEGYMVYLGTTLIDPYTYHAQSDEEGMSINNRSFGNILFDAAEFTDRDGNQLVDLTGSYIVYKGKAEEYEYLDQYPFDRFETDSYYVYLPDSDYAFGKISANAIIWDMGLDDTGTLDRDECIQMIDEKPYIVLVGASYDFTTKRYWEKVMLSVNGICYPAEITERIDIANQIGLSGMDQIGFAVAVPLSGTDVDAMDIDVITLSQDGVFYKYSIV